MSSSFTSESAIGIDYCEEDDDCYSDECCATRWISINGGWSKLFSRKICTATGQDEDGFLCKPKGSIANYTIDYARICESEYYYQDDSTNSSSGETNSTTDASNSTDVSNSTDASNSTSNDGGSGSNSSDDSNSTYPGSDDNSTWEGGNGNYSNGSYGNSSEGNFTDDYYYYYYYDYPYIDDGYYMNSTDQNNTSPQEIRETLYNRQTLADTVSFSLNLKVCS